MNTKHKKHKKTKQKTKQKRRQKTKRKSLKLNISETTYKHLLSMHKGKQKMSLRDRKRLDDALYVKYCKCLQAFEWAKKDTHQGYPICMNSVYKNRGFKPPPNASRHCKKTFNKYV